MKMLFNDSIIPVSGSDSIRTFDDTRERIRLFDKPKPTFVEKSGETAWAPT
jgi:hypothetical protein